MHVKIITGFTTTIFLLISLHCRDNSTSNSLFQYNPDSSPRWISFENKGGIKGQGGMENNKAKGHPCDDIPAHTSIELMNYNGTGIINRIWLTINDRSALMCRSLVINMYWDGDAKPAISAPVGDFFGQGFERKIAFDNEFFSSGEGRSFISFIPMPFKTSARIEIINESDKDLDMIFYDIDLQHLKQWNPANLYLHGFWHRDTATTLTKDFQILPPVKGKGRFMGTNISVIDNPIYGTAWWGEGEVKMYLDGDTDLPTIVGTGTEDYISTAWGQGVFHNKYSGCLIGDDSTRHWAFYRYHIPDPIFFHQNASVSIQQIGGSTKDKVQAMVEGHLPLIPITVHKAPTFVHIYKPDSLVNLKDPSLPDGWVNFYRIDDVAAMAYFYLDKTSDELPALQSKEIRTYKLK
ncbi:MAG: glycoside hydrolase family 172 protein [Saprospiraceae bacterium]